MLHLIIMVFQNANNVGELHLLSFFQQKKSLSCKKMESLVQQAYLNTRMESAMNHWKTSHSASGIDQRCSWGSTCHK